MGQLEGRNQITINIEEKEGIEEAIVIAREKNDVKRNMIYHFYCSN